MKSTRKVPAALLVLALAAGLTACGGDSHSEEHESEAVSGPFKLLPGAPAGYKALAGEATVERAAGGTTVSARVTGLEPNTAYAAHLHSGSCGETDPGGPHFKFDPNGSEEPPNEIHLELRSKADGAARATASSKREVPPGEAGSVVIHEAGGDEMAAGEPGDSEALFVHEGHSHEEPSAPTKIACAELEGGAAHAGAHAGPTIVIRNGEPVGGVEELEYSAGDQIRFTVESDVADEIHVHGYDLSQDVATGGSVEFDFAAEIEGIFEIELEQRKVQIAELRVNP